jgi:hypothetical protein
VEPTLSAMRLADHPYTYISCLYTFIVVLLDIGPSNTCPDLHPIILTLPLTPPGFAVPEECQACGGVRPL